MMNRWLKIAAVTAVAFDFLTPGMGIIGGAFDYAVGHAKAAGLPANTVMVTPPNPTGPASTTVTMMGVGITNEFIPHYDGVALITISGTFSNNTAADGATAQIQYGTGAAPANAGTLAGSLCGNKLTTQNSSLASSVSTGIPFTLTCIATGLTLNVGYWIDIAAAQVTGGTVTLTGVTVTAAEL